MTNEEAVELVGLMANVFRPKDWNATAVKGYALGIVDLPFEPTRVAIVRVLRSARFMPTPSEVREAVRANAVGVIPPWGDAWAEVRHEISRVGYLRGQTLFEHGTRTTIETEFSHPLIQRTVDAMGWASLCESTNVEADRAHFMRMYDAARDSDRSETVAADGLGSALVDSLAAGMVKAIEP